MPTGFGLVRFHKRSDATANANAVSKVVTMRGFQGWGSCLNGHRCWRWSNSTTILAQNRVRVVAVLWSPLGFQSQESWMGRTLQCPNRIDRTHGSDLLSFAADPAGTP